MRRTVLDAMLVLVALWLAAWMAILLIVQPLIVGRGDRDVAAARGTVDITLMTNPGTVLTDFTIRSSGIGRTFSVATGVPVGARPVSGPTVETRLGPIGFSREFVPESDASSFEPVVATSSDLERFGSGTVSTVAIQFDEPLGLEPAQALADDPGQDVRVVWAGFDLGLTFDEFRYGSFGYPTCARIEALDDPQLLGATSASAGGAALSDSASISVALDEVRSAVANLRAHPEVAEVLLGDHPTPQVWASIEGHLAQPDPGVRTIVMTGPSDEVAAAVDELDVGSVAVLGVEFYNWTQPVCGR
jgi:hypothetical protein